MKLLLPGIAITLLTVSPAFSQQGRPGGRNSQGGQQQQRGGAAQRGGGGGQRGGGGGGSRPGSPGSSTLESAGLKVGQPVPDVTVYDENGSKFRMADLKGKHSVIVFGCLT